MVFNGLQRPGRTGPGKGTMELCEGCECEVDQCECGPQDDEWINSAYMAQSAARAARPSRNDLIMMAVRD